MVVLDGNIALGSGPGMDYPIYIYIYIYIYVCVCVCVYIYMYIFQYMIKRTDAITNEVLEPITFVLAYPTVYVYTRYLF